MNMEKAYEAAAKVIKPGEKYTLFGYNEFGFPVTLHTRIHKAYLGSYVQYNNMLYIEHQPKRKRSIYKQPLLPYQTYYLWEGWLDLNNENFWEVEHKGDVTITSSKHLSFDKQYLRDQVKKINIKPIAILDRDYYVDTTKLDFLYQVATVNGAKYYTEQEFETSFKITGKNENKTGRIELQGRPIVSDLLGPMWGGYQNGKAVIRYESQEEYNSNS